MSKELPSICSDKHSFGPKDHTVTPTCGFTPGADVYQEVMVIYSPPPKNYDPQNGDVCQRCLQVYGEEVGFRDHSLAKIYRDLSSWE